MTMIFRCLLTVFILTIRATVFIADQVLELMYSLGISFQQALRQPGDNKQ